MEVMKFRAWHTEKEIMLPPWSIWKTNLVDYEDKCHLILMLYTGVRDKHRRYIYEGDILHVNRQDSIKKHNSLVYFTNGCFCYALINPFRQLKGERKYKVEPLYTWESKNLEIIGNKYEHPEILGENMVQMIDTQTNSDKEEE